MYQARVGLLREAQGEGTAAQQLVGLPTHVDVEGQFVTVVNCGGAVVIVDDVVDEGKELEVEVEVVDEEAATWSAMVYRLRQLGPPHHSVILPMQSSLQSASGAASPVSPLPQ
jgi:hypoxanthine phosphoribosyltransferase